MNILFRPLAYTLTATSLAVGTPQAIPQNTKTTIETRDTFERSVKIPPQGTDDPKALQNAPNPEVKIAGKISNAVIVVDLSKNILYTYDKTGEPTMAYSIASGTRKTPTETGIRVVSHIETYPYKNAPKASKRYKNPKDYGPKIIILEKVDKNTGEKSPTGEFIHGNNNPSSIGKYASHGCMRMDNEVIKELSASVKRGDIVLIKR